MSLSPQALAFLVALLAAASAAATPPAGTESETLFCGTVVELDTWVAGYGVSEGDRYLGSLALTQRDHDGVEGGSTVWDCVANEPCGELRIVLPHFVPPQTAPAAAEIFGPVEEIEQTEQLYRLQAGLDGFVPGATGVADLILLCSGCGPVNDPEDIRPNQVDVLLPVTGEVVLEMFVPGAIDSAQTDLRLSITSLGGACNSALPATSSVGLVALAGLLALCALWTGRAGRC